MYPSSACATVQSPTDHRGRETGEAGSASLERATEECRRVFLFCFVFSVLPCFLFVVGGEILSFSAWGQIVGMCSLPYILTVELQWF